MASNQPQRYLTVYREIYNFVQRNGVAPTRNEIYALCGMAHDSVETILHWWEDRGFVERAGRGNWRGLRLVDQACSECGEVLTPLTVVVVSNNGGKIGLRRRCRSCGNDYHRTWCSDNRIFKRQADRRYYRLKKQSKLLLDS